MSSYYIITYVFQCGRISILLEKLTLSRGMRSPECTNGLWGPPHCPTQWVAGAIPLGLKRTGREAKHVHLVPRVRMSGGVTPLLHMS